MVAAWIDTTAGSTASARSAKLGRPCEVARPPFATSWVADRVEVCGAVMPGTVSCSPPARTMPKMTAPTTSNVVATWCVRGVFIFASVSFLNLTLVPWRKQAACH